MDKEQLLSWMAGFVDGEGCIGIYAAKTSRKGVEYVSYQLLLHISQKTKPSVERFYDFFGFGKLGVEFRKGRPYWYWRVTGPKASETLKQLLPYLFTKKPEAENGTAFQDFKNKLGGRYGGKKGSGFSGAAMEELKAFSATAHALNSN